MEISRLVLPLCMWLVSLFFEVPLKDHLFLNIYFAFWIVRSPYGMLQQLCILFLISSSLCIFNFLLNISFSLVSALNTFFLAMSIFLVPHLQSGHMTVANSTCVTNAWSLNSFLNSFRIFEFIQKYFFKKVIIWWNVVDSSPEKCECCAFECVLEVRKLTCLHVFLLSCFSGLSIINVYWK